MQPLPLAVPLVRLDTYWYAMERMYQSADCSFDIITIDSPRHFLMGYPFVIDRNDTGRSVKLVERINEAIIRHWGILQVAISFIFLAKLVISKLHYV